MSWNINASGTSAAELIKALRAHPQAKGKQRQIPASVVSTIASAVGKLPGRKSGNGRLYLSTNGHFDAADGISTINISISNDG